MRREWLYTWYSPRQQADLTIQECAFDHHYKLYRTGKLYDLNADPFEKVPLNRDRLQNPAAAAATKLQSVLDQFSNVRPEKLDREFKDAKGEKPAKEKSGRRQKVS